MTTRAAYPLPRTGLGRTDSNVLDSTTALISTILRLRLAGQALYKLVGTMQAVGVLAMYVLVLAEFNSLTSNLVCSQHYGQPICCPVRAYPGNCTWYGSPSDCNGQCVGGQITLFRSSYGGAPADSNGGNTDRCYRGDKVFCCNTPQWADIIDACSFGKCGGGCSDGYNAVTWKNDYQICQYYNGYSGPTNRDFCCPTPTKFGNCHWVGQGDCADESCSAADVEILTDAYGDSSSSRNWGRTKVCCCNAPANELYFLPVDLSDIFPTLPPVANNVKFDLQTDI